MEPGASQEYFKQEVDELSVYFQNNIKLLDDVNIKMSDRVSDLPNKEIEVEGIEVV